ncbi:MAG TPA: hypothetical protein QF353_02860 [Gammaproteobacteria bacterium]|nr:hypothetical protein [Gammaproteobacteria bacterium]
MTKQDEHDFESGLNFVAAVCLATLVRLVLIYFSVLVVPLVDMLLFTVYSQMSVSCYQHFVQGEATRKSGPRGLFVDWHKDIMSNLLPAGGVDLSILWLLSMAGLSVSKSNIGLSVLGASSPLIASHIKEYVPRATEYAQNIYQNCVGVTAKK